MDKGVAAKKICNFIDNIRDEIINFTLDCVKQSSETPPGDETAIAELIKKKAIPGGLAILRYLPKNRTGQIFYLV